MSAHIDVIDAVIDLAELTAPYATITRGSLPTGEGITCETSVGAPTGRFMDKDSVVDVTVVFNAKHHNLGTAYNALSRIMTALTRATEYPEGEAWQIIQITSSAVPTIATREETNEWVVGCSLTVQYFVRGD